MGHKLWYISYYNPYHRTYGVEAWEGENPAGFAIHCQKTFSDKPYIILHASEVTKVQFEYIKDYIA